MFVDGPKISGIYGQQDVDGQGPFEDLVIVEVDHVPSVEFEKCTEQVVVTEPHFHEVRVDLGEHGVVRTAVVGDRIAGFLNFAVLIVEGDNTSRRLFVNLISDSAFAEEDVKGVLAGLVLFIGNSLFERVDIVDIPDAIWIHGIVLENELKCGDFHGMKNEIN